MQRAFAKFALPFAVLFALPSILPLPVLGAGAEGPRLDPPPGPSQKPYAPAEGEEVAVTPPPFIWVPAGRRALYYLQVSRSRDFAGAGTRTYGPLARSAFVPREPLEPGDWFWRYGVALEAGSDAPGPPSPNVAWGRARAFRVPPGAREFAFPDLDSAIARVPVSRPRLFFPGQRLEAMRRAAREDLRGPIQSLLRSLERRVGEELVPEPGRAPSAPAERGPWAVRVMRTTRPPMDAMERCALAYLLAGDERFGREAKRRILHFFSWDPEGPTSFFAYDEPPMWLLMRGTRAYDWTYDLFDAEERARVEANMKARALQFLKRLQSLPFESNPYESHAGRLPGFLGECALSFIHEWPEAREWLAYAILLYMTSYPAWGGDDGGWQEGPGYWSSYMSFALHFVVALERAAGFDLARKPFFRATPYYGLYTAPPYHEHAPFGDGAAGAPGPRLAPVLYAFSSLLRDPYLRWYAEAAGYRPGADLLGLATYDPSIAARPPLDLPPARAFPSVGLVSFHTALGDPARDVSFLLRSSPYGSVSHGHADQNAFVVEAFGRGLAIATGCYPWYGSPHHHEWTRATRSVNSILVDGEGQVRRSREAAGEIVLFRSADGYDYAEGEAGRAYGTEPSGARRLESFRRRVVHVRPGVFAIFDDLRAERPAAFQWLLHSYREMEIDAARRRLRVVNPPAAMEVRLLLPETLAFSQTDRYEPEPEDAKGAWENTWHFRAETPSPEPGARFLTVLVPYRVGEEDALPEIELVSGQGASGARIRRGARTAGAGPPGPVGGALEDLVLFRTDPSRALVRCAGEEFEGRVLAVGRDGSGRVLRRLAVEEK